MNLTEHAVVLAWTFGVLFAITLVLLTVAVAGDADKSREIRDLRAELHRLRRGALPAENGTGAPTADLALASVGGES